MSTLTLRPNTTEANPSNMDYTLILYPNSGESAHEDIDEAISDGDSTYLLSDTQGEGDARFGLPNHSTESGTINSVKAFALVRVTDSSWTKYVKVGVYVAATHYYSDSIDIGSETYVLKSNSWAQNPNTSSAWTWNDIDSLEVLLLLQQATASRVGVCYPRCTQVYVEVDYTPSAAVPRHAFINFQGPGIF